MTSHTHRRSQGGCSSSASCTAISSSGTGSKLFQPGTKIIVQRAPIMTGLSIHPLLQKKFQRPMLKRRAYDRNADEALRRASLGQRKRMDGMAKLMARAGRGLTFKLPQRKGDHDGENDDDGSDEEDNNKEPERPFEPLCLWQSPHNGAEPKGIPPVLKTVTRQDEFGIEETVQMMQPVSNDLYSTRDVFVPPVLAKWLRPHQREGVQFMYDCVMGLKDFNGSGCILADDMGLGKTLQSVTLIYTLLTTGITAKDGPTAKRVIVVCPCSLVKNWENEFVKWLGPGVVRTLAIAEAERSKVVKDLETFAKPQQRVISNILICSYECLRAHIKILTNKKNEGCCDLLVCDEAHRLKNSDNQTSKALDSIQCKRRVLLTGTPMQNDLQEFFAMVNFTNKGVLGTQEEFRKNTLFPILRGREPDATEAQKRKMQEIQGDMSATVNEFILRRVNTLNAQHLPPKLVQVVCCNLTEIQQNMYQHLVTSKDMQHVLDGKQVNCLGSIQMLMKLSNHPSLIAQEDTNQKLGGGGGSGRRATAKKVKYSEDDRETAAAPGAEGVSKFLPYDGSAGRNGLVHPEWSGKMFVLFRLMKEMRKLGNGNDKIVIISNYTQTLDLIGRMCRENSWGFCRLDGSIGMKKRQKMVDEFNDPCSSLVAFLLSSKAGGCGLNLIGGNRLVLFDPDWNPAVDKQAAARCWRDGQKKRCFTYRFLATGTVEEKIFQRQLSKEGLQSVVDDKEQVNALSTKDLRNLFTLRSGTPSDTHDKLKCERCKIHEDTAELEAQEVLPKKLVACRELLVQMMKESDASYFLKPMVAQEHGVSTEQYEKVVKQPMDLGTILVRLDQGTPLEKQNLKPVTKQKQQQQPSGPYYKSVSGFSKDVNRIFSNCLKVWSPEEDVIADAARRLQAWWVEQWTELVPVLMSMKPDSDNPKNECDGDHQVEDSEDVELSNSAAVNNERGDDYQDQIGMPDEENLRDWSHHYGTDTVDDPIFRAAMRGYDSVSFVFGLEVTWSLIQERQQEEEERQAMMELEAIQELEEADKENTGDDEDDNIDDANANKNDGSDEDDEAEADAEDEAVLAEADAEEERGEEDFAEEDEDDIEMASAADASAENSVLSQNSEEEEEEEEEVAAASGDTEMTPASSVAEARVWGSASSTETATEAVAVGSTPPTPIGKENIAPKKKNGEWNCTLCTFLNENKRARKCEACDQPRKRLLAD